MLSDKDIKQITGRGMTVESVKRQLEEFVKGFPYIDVESAAIEGNGLRRLSSEETEKYCETYEKYAAGHKIAKFVPASGAATRMFKDLYAYIGGDEANKSARRTIEKRERFAFYEPLAKSLPKDYSGRDVAEYIVSGKGLNYGSAPKALIPFHRYGKESRTALEEHLCEAAQYAVSCDGKARLHFTVSPEHESEFNRFVKRVKRKYERMYGIKYHITTSIQALSTDAIAVNPDNTPFRNGDGSLLFRPAGHGALINNLNSVNADIVFIKNIDNVTTNARRADTIRYKKALAGVLVELQSRSHAYIELLDKYHASTELLEEIARFIEKDLCVQLSEKFKHMTNERLRINFRKILHRPLRVCGMVVNKGEPGGGPFWVVNNKGYKTLQIVEPLQIAPEKRALHKKGTHFNPVDIVCGLRSYRGRKFNLFRYTDESTGFISKKFKDGQPLRALELPGLWNGAMARWNTVFVIVPVTTFTPVKEINDLLRPQHQ